MTTEEMLSTMFYNKFIILDTESTGFQPNNTYSKLLEIGAVKVENGIIVDRFDRLINPGVKISKKISELTGITDKMVAECGDIPTTLKEFREWCGEGYVLVGHNISHDLRFLTFFGDMCGIKFNEPCIDTQKIAKRLLSKGVWKTINSRIKENYKLSSLAILYGIPDQNHHRADNDAEVTWEVLKCLKKTALKENPHLIYNNWIYPEIVTEKFNHPISILSASPWDKGERLYINLSSYFDNEEHFSYIYYDFKNHTWGIKANSFPIPFERVEKFISDVYANKLEIYEDFRSKKYFKDQVV